MGSDNIDTSLSRIEGLLVSSVYWGLTKTDRAYSSSPKVSEVNNLPKDATDSQRSGCTFRLVDSLIGGG